MRPIVTLVIGLITGLLSNLALLAMISMDNETSLKPSKATATILTVTSILAIYISTLLTPISIEYIDKWIITILIIIVLGIQTISDIKTKLVYDMPTIILLAYSSVNLITHTLITNSSERVLRNIGPMLIVLLILFIITFFHGIGSGDTLIYIAIAIYYLTYFDTAWFSLVSAIFIGQLLFLIGSLPSIMIDKVRSMTHDKTSGAIETITTHRPYTLYLSIAVIFTLI